MKERLSKNELGRFFIIGFHGTQFNREIRDLLDEFNPSGVILFSRNYQDPFQLSRLTADLQSHAKKERHNVADRLFIGIDQEGGRVARLKSPFLVSPAAFELASHGSAEAKITELAARMSAELRLVGINVDFTPVLDVLPDTYVPEKSVIGDRSFGSDPLKVSICGNLVIEAFRKNGVIPCGKHFPGHGGTTVDSHKELPRDFRTLEELETRDLIPFMAAIKNDIELLMTAHITYPHIDDRNPATFSRIILTDLLRNRFGYPGLVISDDLDMGAVSNNSSPGESAVKAISAGVDLLLFCNDPNKAFAARDELDSAIGDGIIDQTRLIFSLQSIKKLKSKYSQSFEPCSQASVRDYFSSIESV